MEFPSKFPSTFNYRIQNGFPVTQQITKQAKNQYTVKTWIHRIGTAEEVGNASELTRAEAIAQLEAQFEYADILQSK